MTKAQNSPGWDGRFKTTFKKLLEAHLRKQHMASQTIKSPHRGWRRDERRTRAPADRTVLN
jgi:hypothetical protein